jgi:hypothetical protein
MLDTEHQLASSSSHSHWWICRCGRISLGVTQVSREGDFQV